MANGWFVGGHSTAAGVVCEKASASGANLPFGSARELVLRGFSYMNQSSLASSTKTATLRIGDSSGVGLSSIVFAQDTNEFALSVGGINLSGKYFAVATESTHSNGVAACMWGDYA
jgi:hypothetical protein